MATNSEGKKAVAGKRRSILQTCDGRAKGKSESKGETASRAIADGCSNKKAKQPEGHDRSTNECGFPLPFSDSI